MPPLLDDLIALSVPDELIDFRDTEFLRDWLYSRQGIEVTRIGQSLEEEELFGYRFGHGTRNVSIIAGCHADEPIGPATAQLFSDVVRDQFPELLDEWRFHVVPQMNPDGAERNRRWFSDPLDLDRYLAGVIRELPGDDIEFGFSTRPGARPENRAAMHFLRSNAPYAAHFTLHGMGFAEGVWCLLSPQWSDRADNFMHAFTALCEARTFPMHDVDRGGEKGFSRIREGFSTHPNSRAMRAFFEERNDDETARKFRPSSMEWVRNLGGDPLCVVSELPLFLVGKRSESLDQPLAPEVRKGIAGLPPEDADDRATAVRDLMDSLSIKAVPIREQIEIQIGMILLALKLVAEQPPEPDEVED